MKAIHWVFSGLLLLTSVHRLSFAQPADSPWPMYQHDAQHTGRVDVMGPESPRIDWIFAPAEGWLSMPIIDGDSVIYFYSTSDTLFYALHPDGTVKWIYNYNGAGYVGAECGVVSEDHIHFVRNTWEFDPHSGSYWSYYHILNKDGTLYWQNGGGTYWYYNELYGSPIIGSDGRVYVVGDSIGVTQDVKLYAFDDTLVQWTSFLKQGEGSTIYASTPAIGPDGTIYVALDDSVYAINPDGTRKWSVSRGNFAPADWRAHATLSVGGDGTIYFVSEHVFDSLTAVDPSGNIKWRWGARRAHIYTPSPAIGWGDTLYFVSFICGHGDCLVALTADGDSIFIVHLPLAWNEDIAHAQIAVTKNMLYICGEGPIFAFTHNGKLKWKYKFELGYEGYMAIAISYDGIIGIREDIYEKEVFCIREGNYAIQLLSPNGGENLPTSNPYNITWSSQNVDSVSLYYTLEGSDYIIDYIPIIEKIPNTGEYEWQLPDTSCSSCRVAVVATDSRGNILSIDMSDSNFTIDNTHPETWIDPLPRFINSLSFEITWHGYDPGDGTGLDHFDVQYRDGDDPWIDWITGTTDTTAIFTGQENHKYYFRCRGVDKSGNVEPYPNYDTYTYIDITQPTITDVSPAENGLAGSQPIIHAVIEDPSPGSGLILDSIKVIFDDTLAYHYPVRVTYDDYTGEVGFRWYGYSLDYGDHTITVSAMDSAANWNSVTHTFHASFFADKKWELVNNMSTLGGDDTSSLYDESETEDYLLGLTVDDEAALERLCLGEDVMYKLEGWTEKIVQDFMWAFTDLKILSDGCVDNIRRQVEAWIAEDSAAYADSIESATETVERIVNEYEDFIDLGISIVDEYYGTGFGDLKTYISAMYDLTSPNDEEIIYQFRQIATRIVMNSFLRITQPSLDDILDNAISHNFTGTYGEAQQATGGLMEPAQYPDGSILKIYKDWYTAADDSIYDYISTAHTFEFVSWLFGILGLPVGEFDIGIVFEKWSEMIATLEYLRAMQVALRYYVGVADTSTGGIREGTILAFFPDSSVSKPTLCESIPRKVIEKFKSRFRDAKADYETCLLHIQQLVDNGEVDSVRLLLPTLVELDRQYSFQSRVSKAPILAVADTAYAEDVGFANELFDLHVKFVNSNSERYRVNRVFRGVLCKPIYVDSVDAQVPVVIATNDTLEGMTSALLDSTSDYPASPIVLPSYYQVVDRVAVGDTFSLHANITNGGAGIAHNVRVQLITPEAINVVGEDELYIGDLGSGDEVEVTWLLMCREADGPVSLTVAPRADNGKSMSKTVNITTEYVIAPEIGGVTVDPQIVAPYGYVVINAYVTGVKGINWVRADITSSDGFYHQTVYLRDDGHHHDGGSGDHLYGYRWRTPSYAKDYYVSITAEDIGGNYRTRGNVVGFTSKEFDKMHNVLLVNDNLDRYEVVNDDTTIVGGDIESYYKQSLDNLGFGYDVWHTICKGGPSDSILELYRRDGCVIWATGTYEGSAISVDSVRKALTWYLNREGRLFMTGQDIAWGLTRNGSENSYLLENYLKVNFLCDDASDYELVGVAGDPISDGLNICISGGDGANNQRYPDVVKPIDNGVTIFNYTAGGAGGVRVANRTIFLGFGFEAINSNDVRDTIMARIMSGFSITGVEEKDEIIAPLLQVYPNPVYNVLYLRLNLTEKEDHLTVEFYDLVGRLVETIVNENVTPGVHTLRCNMSHLSCGIYFMQVRTPLNVYIRKITLIR